MSHNPFMIFGIEPKDLRNKTKHSNLWMIYIIEQFKI